MFWYHSEQLSQVCHLHRPLAPGYTRCKKAVDCDHPYIPSRGKLRKKPHNRVGERKVIFTINPMKKENHEVASFHRGTFCVAVRSLICYFLSKVGSMKSLFLHHLPVVIKKLLHLWHEFFWFLSSEYRLLTHLSISQKFFSLLEILRQEDS